MEVSAVQRFVRRTPRKARLVADSVKGMRVTEALAVLESCHITAVVEDQPAAQGARN